MTSGGLPIFALKLFAQFFFIFWINIYNHNLFEIEGVEKEKKLCITKEMDEKLALKCEMEMRGHFSAQVRK